MSGSSSRSPGVGPEEFRRLMARFATGVTVATTRDQSGKPQGMTASAVAAVSLDPPILLVCVDHAADFHAAVSAVPRFALSVLSSDQEHLSRRFAEDRPDRFSGVAWQEGAGGLPLLDDAVAHLVCGQWGTYEAGDHTVFFGRLEDGAVFDRQPLIHFRGGYTTAGPA